MTDQMDAITVLTRDHNEVKEMLARLESTPNAATGASGEQLEQRKSVVEQLVMELSRHEAAEEQYLWPTVRESMANGEQLAETAVGQEQEGKEALAKLDGMSADNLDFESLLTQTAADLREHIRTEEEVFAMLKTSVSHEQLVEMGGKIEKAKKIAPTRPHPNAPNSAMGQKVAGAMAAPMDRIRDAVKDRGE